MKFRILRLSQIAIDLAVLAFALVAAFMVRFDGDLPPSMAGRLLLTGPSVVALEYVILLAFGTHRFSWRYVGLHETKRILMACAAATGVLLLARLVVGQSQDAIPNLRHGAVPIGVIATNAVLAFVGVMGVRVARRMLGERTEAVGRRASSDQRVVPTLLVGAGQAGVLVARELRSRPDLGMRAVGFVDDDPLKAGVVIHGVPVVGDTSRIPALCERYRAEQVLITMAGVPGQVIRRIRSLCDEVGVPVKIIPGVYEIVGGTVNLSRIRDVAIEDLLGRAPVELDVGGIAAHLSGKVVMTTGAGGSIGSELCRQIARFHPSALLLVERSENALFNIHRELIATFPSLTIVPCVADITDFERMNALFAEHRPVVVLHAAAHKHVPMMEWNPGEAIKNNVFGTKMVAELAGAHGVESFVMISTDKAVNPSSVMGASKRAAELYVQALAKRHPTRFVTVRFGNVLGSAGSVIPIFREQIERGGPVTVTHPDMRRYFMTIPEACQLVLQAGAMGEGGEIFILDMGEPVKVVDLARDLIALSGLREGEDIEIIFSGVRPGEKLFEELTGQLEHADRTRHQKILVARTGARTWDDLMLGMRALEGGVREGGRERALMALRTLVPEFRSPPAHPGGSGGPDEATASISEKEPQPSPLLQNALAH